MDALEQLVKTWDVAAGERKEYDARRAYAKCAADLRFVLTGTRLSLRDRIVIWIRTRLGERLLTSRWERSMRVLEEAMELAQTEGVDVDQLMKLAARVYSRPKGEPAQEAAGLQVCLLAWSHAAKVELETVTADEVYRIETMSTKRLHDKQNEKAALGVALPPEV